MKKNLSKRIIIFVSLLSTILLFSQPSYEDDTGVFNLEGGDTAPAGCIDSEICLFTIVGVGLAFYYFYRKRVNEFNE